MTEIVPPRRPAWFWLGAALAFFAALYLLRSMLLPFVAGLAIAYLLDPVTDRMERHMPRSAAAGIIIGGFFVSMVLLIAFALPLAIGQIGKLIEAVPALIDKVHALAAFLLSYFGTDFDLTTLLPEIKTYAKDASKQILSMLGQLGVSLLGGGAAILNVVSLVFITPIIAFYLLVDWDRLVAKVDSWLPRDYAPRIRACFRDINGVLSGFVRGQALICATLAAYYAVGLSLAGLPSGFVIGLVTGGIAFIPFVGAGVAGILSIGLALYTWWPDFHRIGIVVAVFLIGQILEGKVLTPKLMGARVGLHPVWVIFGLFAGGALMGFVGMLIAVPLFAVLGVLARFGVQEYLHSPYYYGHSGTAPDRKERGLEG